MKKEETPQILELDIGAFPLGVTVESRYVAFRVAVLEDSPCYLLLFPKGETEPQYRLRFPKNRKIGGICTMAVGGLCTDAYDYAFESDGSLFLDPYSRRVTGREQWADRAALDKPARSGFYEDSFDWKGDKPLHIPYEENIIYRIHPRGFTKHPSSKTAFPGAFAGIRQKIPYLRQLGINLLEIMPVYEFEELEIQDVEPSNPYSKPLERIHYWGYTKGWYFAPKSAYASHDNGKTPDVELKELIRDLHKNGIEAVFEFYFAPGTNPILALDALHFWVTDYHVDGFHILGDAPIAIIGRDPLLCKTKLFAADWSLADSSAFRHLAEYHDGFLIDIRRLLKGDENCLAQLVERTKCNPADKGRVNYIANTNGFTLHDMVCYDRKHNEANGEENQDGGEYNYSWNCGQEGPARKKKILSLRKQQIRNALTILYLSQGIPLLLSGDELGHTKNGNNNSYCQDNEISWINWRKNKSNQEIYEFVRFLISFRKKHPIFHRTEAFAGSDEKENNFPEISVHGVNPWRPEYDRDKRQLGLLYYGRYVGDDSFYVMYNMHWEPHLFSIPGLPDPVRWHIAIDTSLQTQNGFYESGEEILLGDQREILVEARSVIVLIAKPEDRRKGKFARETGKDRA